MATELVLVERFVQSYPAEAGRVLERFSADRAARFLEQLTEKNAARLLTRMGPNAGAAALHALDADRAQRLVTELAPHAAAELLRHGTPELQKTLLDAMEPSRARAIQKLLHYPPETAGALADPLVLALPDDLSVAEAQRQLSRTPHGLLYYIYVVDRQHRLVGVVDMRELFLASRKEALSAVMHRQLTALEDWVSTAGIAVHPGWADYDALPVVDVHGTFVGAIKYRALRQRLTDTAGDRTRAAAFVTALFNMGELYWVGLSTVITAFAAPGRGSGKARRPTSQGDADG